MSLSNKKATILVNENRKLKLVPRLVIHLLTTFLIILLERTFRINLNNMKMTFIITKKTFHQFLMNKSANLVNKIDVIFKSNQITHIENNSLILTIRCKPQDHIIPPGKSLFCNLSQFLVVHVEVRICKVTDECPTSNIARQTCPDYPKTRNKLLNTSVSTSNLKSW